MRNGLKILLAGGCLTALPLLSGCAAAAGAAAGTAAGMAYEDRGAESYVTQSVAAATAAARTALPKLGVVLDEGETEAEATQVELKGKDDAQEVHVTISGNGDAGRTHIFVTVKKNVVDYDKSRADELLKAILAELKK